MVSYSIKERKKLRRLLRIDDIENKTDKELSKMLISKYLKRYRFNFISGNEDMLDGELSKDLINLGVKAYILV